MNEWPKPESPRPSFEMQFDKLSELLEKLAEKGYATRPLAEIQEELRKGITTPIVFDGADGIRVRHEKSRGIVLGFTNGFEDPKDERVREVRELWNLISAQK